MTSTTPVRTRTDRELKRERLLGLLDRRGADRLVLTTATSLGWYLDGARTHVSLAAPPIAAVIVDRDGEELVTTDNESERLIAEELPAGMAVRTVPWHAALPLPAGSGTLREEDALDDLRRLRAPLLPAETARFRALAADAARMITGVLAAARPEQTETELAAAISAGIVTAAAEPLVVLVGGESRQFVRHPLPTAAQLGRRALVVVCARRHGLIVNVSRSVVFGTPTAADIDGHERILAVEAAFLDATVPGAVLSEVFATGCAAYGRNGFDAEEWQRHHQGGVAGYAGRDPRASDGTGDVIVAGQAFSWNPTGDGAKVEDTVLLTDSGLEVLTADPAWPTRDVGGRRRPDLLTIA